VLKPSKKYFVKTPPLDRTPLQTTIDTLESTKTTIENVDNLIDARILSEGLVDETFLGQNHYTKGDTDALIPDVSEYETTAQLDTRLADYTTISLFEAHENLMELELAGKADTTAIPDVSGFIYHQFNQFFSKLRYFITG